MGIRKDLAVENYSEWKPAHGHEFKWKKGLRSLFCFRYCIAVRSEKAKIPHATHVRLQSQSFLQKINAAFYFDTYPPSWHRFLVKLPRPIPAAKILHLTLRGFIHTIQKGKNAFVCICTRVIFLVQLLIKIETWSIMTWKGGNELSIEWLF